VVGRLQARIAREAMIVEDEIEMQRGDINSEDGGRERHGQEVSDARRK